MQGAASSSSQREVPVSVSRPEAAAPVQHARTDGILLGDSMSSSALSRGSADVEKCTPRKTDTRTSSPHKRMPCSVSGRDMSAWATWRVAEDA